MEKENLDEQNANGVKPDVTKSLPLRGLLELLALHKGSIVSSASLDVENIRQAQASGRMYVDENSLGYVWMPEDDFMPDTPEKVELFEKWYPLPVEMPEALKNWRPWLPKITVLQKKTPWADNNGRIKHT